MHSLHAVLFFYITLSKLIRGDYECLCNYNRGASVFPQMNTQLTPSGQLYKFECKPTYQVSGLGQNWTAIQYKRQVKYVFMDALIRLQICPGYPANADIVRKPAMTTTSKNLPQNSTGSTTISNSTTQSFITTGFSTQRLTTSRTSSTSKTSKATKPLKTTLNSITSKIKPLILSASTLTPSTQTTATTSTASTTVTTSYNMDTTLVISNRTILPVTTPPTTHSTKSELATQTTDAQATTVRISQFCPPRVPRTPFLKEYGSNCYRFIINNHTNWQNAENDCRTYGGHLVSIGSYAEQMFVYNTLRLLHFHGDAGVWIGFTDQGHENHWTWASGEPVRYTYWASDQPGSLFGSLEDCALMDMGLHGRWDDYSCDGILFSKERHGWVCEYHKI